MAKKVSAQSSKEQPIVELFLEEKGAQPEKNRRDFMKIAGLGAAGVIAAMCQGRNDSAFAQSSGSLMQPEIMFSGDLGCEVINVIDNKYDDTLVSLKQQAEMTDQQIVYVAGYWKENDGGGGFFQWVDTVETPDDGGTIFAPEIAINGRWVRLFERGVLYAKWFGVAADGADDYIQFQKIIAYADNPENKDGTITIRLPSSPIRLDLVQPLIIKRDNFCLVGPDAANTYIYGINKSSAGFIVIGKNGHSKHAAITFAGKSQIGKNFMIAAENVNCGYMAGLDTCTYNGIFENIGIKGFEFAHRVYRYADGRDYTEAINNQFTNICGYPLSKSGVGLAIGNVEGTPNEVKEHTAVNENTWMNCRYRGERHCLWICKIGSPRSYGLVFINCIFQEKPAVGDGYYELLKVEGEGVEGVTFLNGRFESIAEEKRKSTVLDCNGIAPSSNFIVIGTYIHSSILIKDNNCRVRTLGHVNDNSWKTSELRASRIVSLVESTNTNLELNSNGGMLFNTDINNITNGGDFIFTSDDKTEILRLVGRNGGLLPGNDASQSLGYSGKRWKDVWAKKGLIQTSDENEKQEVTPETLGLDFINSLNPVQFKWKQEDGIHHGLIAQEFKEVLDTFGVNHAAYIDAGEEIGLCYTELISSLIKAIQELSQFILEIQAPDSLFLLAG